MFYLLAWFYIVGAIIIVRWTSEDPDFEKSGAGRIGQSFLAIFWPPLFTVAILIGVIKGVYSGLSKITQQG